MSKVNVVDSSNLMLICLNIAFLKAGNPESPDFAQKVWESYFWLLFKKFKQIYSTCDKAVFCFEGKDSTKWRKSIYPDYKGTRNHDSDPTWPLVLETFKITREVASMFPATVLAVDNCEADDEMYAAAKIETEKGNDVDIWSSDKDLIQVMNYFPKAKVFGIREKAYREANPNIVEEKSICGDGSDNIKGIPKVGPKGFQRMMEEQEYWNKIMTPENKAEYEKCKTIVDLRNCPFTNDIEAVYESSVHTLDEAGLKMFFEEKNIKTTSLWEATNAARFKKPC